MGFAAVALLSVGIAVVGIYALRSVIHTKDQLISDYADDLLLARKLEVTSEQEIAGNRAFLLTRDPHFVEKSSQARSQFFEILAVLRARSGENRDTGALDRLEGAEEEYQATMRDLIGRTESTTDIRDVARLFEASVTPRREELRTAFQEVISTREALLDEAIEDSRRAAQRMTLFVAVIGAGSAIGAGGLFVLSWRILRRLGQAERDVRRLNEELEARVAERTADLSRAVKDIEGFAYTVAHDLRAPLRAMSGLCQLLAEDVGPRMPDPGPEYLSRVEAAARRMDQLIQGLLEYSRLAYSSVEIRPSSLGDAVTDVLASMKAELESRAGRVEVIGSLPDVLGNDPLLRQIFGNLIGNALKFVTPRILPRVQVGAERLGERVRVWVSDNGVGIPPEYHDRVFGVFQRLHRAEEFPGTGIGLAIVRRAAERMGGTAGVESEPGKGSRFWVELRAATDTPKG